MLRMGRSPKVESNEPRPAESPSAPTQPLSPPQTLPTQTYPYQPQPAAQSYEQPARPAQMAPVATPSAPRAVTESEALARDLREGVVSGFVGGSTVVSGDAEFKGMLRIDGRFTGRVRSEKGSLIVSAGGVVEANIEVASAKINGTVNGDILATGRVELGRSARVQGNIRTPALVIEEGAVFEGNCRMQAQPEPEPVRAHKAEAPRPTATASTQPKPSTKPTAEPTPTGNGAGRAATINMTSPEPTA
jgi:cytoskeletal protein CcmA (bactofilin family)